ncbi:MAG: response regulator transcription factor, partial [Sphingobacteriales bacterium]
MIRLLLADDHRLFLDGLGSLFTDVPEITIVGKASNGKEVLRLLAEQEADLVLLDVNMPELDGLETTIKAKCMYPHLKILILTMYNT